MRLRLLIGLCMAPLLAGCITGSARIWSQDTTGGVLALEGDEGKAMQDAERKMAAHCGIGNYVIVKRETVVTGREHYATSDTDYGENQRTDTQAATVGGGQTTTTYGGQESAQASGASSTAGGPGGSYSEGGAQESAQGSGYEQTTSGGMTASAGTQRRNTEGGSHSESVSGVRDVTQMRVHYQCRNAPPPAPPAPPPPPPPPPQ